MSIPSSLLLLAAAAVVLAPAALAQAPAHTLTIEIQDLPESVASNGTQVAVPFTVRATVAGAAPCIVATGGSQYTIELEAEVVNSTGNATQATVSPRQVTIAGPVLLSQAGQAERTEEAVLIVSSGPYRGDALNATVRVTASFAGGNPGCVGTGSTAASSDEEQLAADFQPVPPLFGNGAAASQEMPAPGALLLMAVLGAVVVALRRRA